MKHNDLSISELAEQSGLSPHTIRYYESIGVLKASNRAANGHRRYNNADVLWLAFVLRLKLIGMPLAQIKQYAQLRDQGDTTLEPRLALLKQHREHLRQKMAALAECADVLDSKLHTYKKMIAKAKTKKE